MNLRSGLSYGAAFLAALFLHIAAFVALQGLVRPGADAAVEPQLPLHDEALVVSFRRPEAVALQPEPARPVTRLREPVVSEPETPPQDPSVEALPERPEPAEDSVEMAAEAELAAEREPATRLREVPAAVATGRPSASATAPPSPAVLVQKPRPLKPIDAEALYPLGARLRGEQGTVRLTVRVGTDGRVRELAIDESSGFTVLDQAAERAVRRTRFAPATRNEQPIAGELSIAIRFRLDS